MKMNWLNILNQVIVFIGVPAIIGGLIYFGRKLQILDDLKDSADKIEGDLDSFTKCASGAIVEIQTHLAGRGFIINQKLAYTAASPLKLTEYGEKIMEESGFYKAIRNETTKKKLVDLVKDRNPKTNYDIQQFSSEVIKDLAKDNDLIAIPLKEYSYEKGLPLEIVLNSAGIVLRDEVMKDLKFADRY